MNTAIEEIERKHEEIGKMIASLKALKTTFPRTIEAPELSEGEIYVGTFINADGIGHHTILLPGDKDEGSWQDAMDWAKGKGGDLPNRIEQATLFASQKQQFQEDWYWSNITHHKESEWAWCQDFYDGYQSSGHESFNYCRARAVRRLEI